MAKESRFQKLIYSGYRNGFWQSMVVHELLFIVLALIFIKLPVRDKPIIISFNSSSQEELYIEDTHVLSLDFEHSTDLQTDLLSLNASQMLELTELTELDAPNLDNYRPDYVQQNPNNIKLEDLEASELSQEVLMPEAEVQTLANDSQQSSSMNNGETQSAPASTAREKFISFLNAGSKLADGIPPQALAAANASGGDMLDRLNAYGAKTGDIQVSLMWQTVDDIDLHVSCSNNIGTDTIWWRNKYGISGGILDIDMNGPGPINSNPIENIFWPYNTAPQGQYIVAVNFFRSWTGKTSIPFTVRIKTLKGEQYYNAIVNLNQPAVVVANFSN